LGFEGMIYIHIWYAWEKKESHALIKELKVTTNAEKHKAWRYCCSCMFSFLSKKWKVKNRRERGTLLEVGTPLSLSLSLSPNFHTSFSSCPQNLAKINLMVIKIKIAINNIDRKNNSQFQIAVNWRWQGGFFLFFSFFFF
jgi:hypothetical protein